MRRYELYLMIMRRYILRRYELYLIIALRLVLSGLYGALFFWGLEELDWLG